MSVALNDIRKRVGELKEKLKEINPENIYYFGNLEKILEMYEYIAESRKQEYNTHTEKYQKELDKNDKGQA